MRKTAEHQISPRGLGPRQRFIVFLPDHLADQVRSLATQGRRPINTQFEIIVERGLRRDEPVIEAVA